MQEINIIEEGKKAVEIETLGCQAVLNSINEDFVKLVDIIKIDRLCLSRLGTGSCQRFTVHQTVDQR